MCVPCYTTSVTRNHDQFISMKMFITTIALNMNEIVKDWASGFRLLAVQGRNHQRHTNTVCPTNSGIYFWIQHLITKTIFSQRSANHWKFQILLFCRTPNYYERAMDARVQPIQTWQVTFAFVQDNVLVWICKRADFHFPKLLQQCLIWSKCKCDMESLYWLRSVIHSIFGITRMKRNF